MCGATGAQKDLLGDQTSFYHTAMSQATKIFGTTSRIVQDLVNTFSPIVAAGPNQAGFSAGELAARNSSVVANTAAIYKNAATAVGEKTAAMGGGNEYIPSGAATQVQAALASEAAGKEAEGLNEVQKENYAVGRQNFWGAESALAGAPGAFNPAIQAVGAADNSGKAAADTANEIAQADNSWVNGVTGALGGIAGAAAGGYLGRKKA